MAGIRARRWGTGLLAALAGAVGATATGPGVAPAAPAAAAVTSSPTAALHSVADCLTRPQRIAVRGVQQGRFTDVVAADTAVDALGAMWLAVDNWPVSITGGAGSCWVGGRMFGTYDQSTPWAEFHHTGAFNVTNPDFAVVELRAHNYGDGVRIRAGARDFTISGAHLSFMHDDCIENDQLYSGVITDSLLDGCYVALSARPSSGDAVDGRDHRVVVRGNVVRLQAMPTVYKGKAPGHGGFFKWDEHGRGPRLVVADNVFRVDSRPNHQTLGLPAGYDVSCSNNVVVWLGKGRYPDKLPKCFRVTRDERVWEDAVAAWRSAHPLNP